MRLHGFLTLSGADRRSTEVNDHDELGLFVMFDKVKESANSSRLLVDVRLLRYLSGVVRTFFQRSAT